MDIILWAILGGLAGWIASIIMKTDAEMGIPANIVVGIVGALLGGWIMKLFGSTGTTGFNFWSLLVAILGSVVLLAIVRSFRRPILR